MRAQEFILTESRSYLCEAYQRQATTLIEQFCKQSVRNKFTVHQIFEMFEAVPAGQAPAPTAPQDAAAVQKGQQILGQAKTSLAQGIQRTGERVQNFDEKFDAYATQLAQKFPATNKVIQAFRKWGHEHPVAEHAILFALATAAGVAAPGIIGSAVAVGLLTTAFKLIMGKKFSQSVKSGAAAGLIAGALGSAVNGIEALAHAHHASPALTKGAESIAHGAIEHTAGDVIGDLAAGGAEALGTLATTAPNIRGAVSAARTGNYGSALKQVNRT
jgi:hypothetical protein